MICSAGIAGQDCFVFSSLAHFQPRLRRVVGVAIVTVVLMNILHLRPRIVTFRSTDHEYERARVVLGIIQLLPAVGRVVDFLLMTYVSGGVVDAVFARSSIQPFVAALNDRGG